MRVDREAYTQSETNSGWVQDGHIQLIRSAGQHNLQIYISNNRISPYPYHLSPCRLCIWSYLLLLLPWQPSKIVQFLLLHVLETLTGRPSPFQTTSELRSLICRCRRYFHETQRPSIKDYGFCRGAEHAHHTHGCLSDYRGWGVRWKGLSVATILHLLNEHLF